MDITLFPHYYRNYLWDGKHKLFGHPPDRYPEFQWIRSLEHQFLNFRQGPTSAPELLLAEMIQWGGNQHGVLRRFQSGLPTYSLDDALAQALKSLNNPEQAIEAALAIPGLGLTYASKLLRFFDPETYGALDSRIRKGLAVLHPAPLPNIYDGNRTSMTKGFVAYVRYLRGLRDDLLARGVPLPSDDTSPRPWRVADVEMALFGWVSGTANSRES